MAKVSRSQFIEKLHSLLDDAEFPDSLRWVSDDSFEITSNDARAREALSPKFDFRSLSSFIRQLSYYNFKRLSDRRRSSERRTSSADYIVFSHPTNLFIRGDPSRLSGITRKIRNRPEKNGARRVSSSSAGTSGSYEDGEVPPMPSWPLSDGRMYPEERRHFGSIPSFQSSFASYGHDAGHGYQQHEPANWRAYHPPDYSPGNHPDGDKLRVMPQNLRRSSDYGAALPPLTKRLEMAGRSRAGSLSFEPVLHHNDDYRTAYPTPNFAPPSYDLPQHRGSISGGENSVAPLPSSNMPTGLAASYEPPTYRHPFAPGNGVLPLPSPTDSIYSAGSGEDSPLWHPSQLPPMQHRDSLPHSNHLTSPRNGHDYSSHLHLNVAPSPHHYFAPQHTWQTAARA